jgi:hypothetical protein
MAAGVGSSTSNISSSILTLQVTYAWHCLQDSACVEDGRQTEEPGRCGRTLTSMPSMYPDLDVPSGSAITAGEKHRTDP